MKNNGRCQQAQIAPSRTRFRMADNTAQEGVTMHPESSRASPDNEAKGWPLKVPRLPTNLA
jgi:hypothetical protein